MDYFKNIQLQKALLNTSAQFLVKLINSFTSFIATLAIVYFFGIKEFGSFTKVLTFVSFSYLLVDFGLNSVFLKDYYDKVEKYFPNIVYLRIITAFIMFFIMATITLFLPYDPITGSGFSPLEKFYMLIFSLTIFTQGLYYSISNIFQKNLAYHLSLIPTTASSVTLFFFIATGITTKDLLFLFLAYPVGGIVYFITAFLISNNQFHLALKPTNFIPFSKDIVKSAAPIGAMLFLNLIYFRVDTLILSFYKSNSDVGVYGFAFKVFELIIAFPTFFSNSVYPILIKTEKTPEEFSKHIKKYSLFLLLLSLLFFAGLIVFSPFVRFFKSDLYASVLPLRILAFSIPLFFVTNILQWVFIIKSRKKTLLFIYFISMLFNITLNIFLIPQYGYIASAVITVISELCVLLLILFFMIRYNLLRDRKDVNSYSQATFDLINQ